MAIVKCSERFIFYYRDIYIFGILIMVLSALGSMSGKALKGVKKIGQVAMYKPKIGGKLRGGLGKVADIGGKNIVGFNPMAGQALDVADALRNRNYIGAASSLAMGGKSGALAHAGGGAISRGVRTAGRTKGGLKKKVFGFTRGAKTGAAKSSYQLRNAFIPGSATMGAVANNLVKSSPIGGTRVGKALTTDIAAPLRRKLKVKQRVRAASGGLFSSNDQLVYFN